MVRTPRSRSTLGRPAATKRTRAIVRLGAALLGAAIVGDTRAESAAGWLVDRWSVEHGLPNNALSDVLQTRDGYLWIATWAGIVRFDGIRFTPIAAPLPNNHARVLLDDPDGGVWIGLAAGGLVRWRDGSVTTAATAQDLGGNDAYALARDRDGRIWIGTENAISVVDGGRTTTLGAAHGFPEGVGGALAAGRDGQILIGSSAGVCEARGLEVQCRRPAVAGSINAILQDRGGHLWIGSNRGLFTDGAGDGRARARCGGDPCVLAGAITELLEARDGTIWAGFGNGHVAAITPSTVQQWGVADGLPAGSVVALREDPEGSIWVGTVNGGLARLKRARVATYAAAEGLPAQVVGSIVQDTHGSIYAATECGPISQLGEDGRFVPRFAELTGDACAWVLWAARDGSFWIGTRGGGLFRWSRGRVEHFGTEDGLSDTTIRGLFEDRDGVIWIGTETGGVHRYADGRLSRAFGPADGVATYIVASFAQDRSGRIWIGSNGNGLSVYENGRFRLLSPAESPPTRDIAGLLVDSRGDLWIGSAADGLFRLRNGRYEPFGVAQGLGDRLVAVMVEDRDGHMWVATTRGIARLDRERIDAVADGRETHLQPITLDRTDGMRNTEGSGGGLDPSGLRDAAGRLWFSTIDGIVVVDPARFAVNRVVPHVLVESVTIDERAAAPGSGRVVTVPPGTNAIEIAYTSFSLIAPLKSRFRYRLTGFDDRWHDVGGRRTAYFSRLPPGEYVFEVMASNNDGVWSTEPATIALAVQPFIWERREARAAALAGLLVATGLAATMVAQRRARRRLEDLERAHALERERTRIARDLHDDLGARLSHIALMSEAGPSTARPGLAAAARDAVEVLDELVWAVNARNDTVESFATYAGRFAEAHVTAAGLRYRASLGGDLAIYELASDARRHLYLAVKEAVNNAVKHAGATEILLHVEAGSRELRIQIVDDGRGMPGDGGDPTGNGLASMRDRLAAVHGTMRIDPRAGGGTCVTFTAPVTPKTT